MQGADQIRIDSVFCSKGTNCISVLTHSHTHSHTDGTGIVSRLRTPAILLALR